MSPWLLTFIIILAVLLVAVIVLYFVGKRLEKRQAAQKEQIDAAAQQITLFILKKDKKRLKDAGLPPIVMEQANAFMKRAKLPIVHAKIVGANVNGSKMMTFIADDAIYPLIPEKKEVKATVSGLYITGVKALRGQLEKPQGKKKLGQRLRDKYDSLSAQTNTANKTNNKKSGKKK